jgi:hypothetical protein
MLPIRTICALFLVLVASSQAKEEECRFEKPEAQTVGLMAEFNQWKGQPMTKQSNGTWTIKVSIPPGTYGYKFLVDGKEWVFDPKNSQRKTVDGVENSSIEIREEVTGPAVPTATPVTTPSGSSVSAGALSVTPGEITTFEASLSVKQRAEAAKDNPRIGTARAALAVPQGFDPQRNWPILVISNTEAYSNIDSMRQFKQTAIDEGWVIMAADAVQAEKNQGVGAVARQSRLRLIMCLLLGRRQRIGLSLAAECLVAPKIPRFSLRISPASTIASPACSLWGVIRTWPQLPIVNPRRLGFSLRPSS